MTSPLFQIKICGVKTVPDIAASAQAGADAIGLNFYPDSIRYVEPEFAVDLSRAAAVAKLLRVGVFVDSDAKEIARVAGLVELDAVQLHGNEPVEVVRALIGLGTSVLKAVRLPLGRLSESQVEQALAPWLNLQREGTPVHLLIDADAGAAIGGAGERLDWVTLGRWCRASSVDGGWVLAGGLNPDNVAEGIAVTGAKAVDVASGVEAPRGKKSPERIEAFVKTAQTALAVKPS